MLAPPPPQYYSNHLFFLFRYVQIAIRQLYRMTIGEIWHVILRDKKCEKGGCKKEEDYLDVL